MIRRFVVLIAVVFILPCVCVAAGYTLADEFAYIPANPTFAFSKALNNKEKGSYVSINNDYYMAIFPVTNGEYRRFLQMNASHRYPKHWANHTLPKNTDNQPVVGISYYDALDYIAWFQENHKGFKFRLPTEEEWENAAKGPNGDDYPWKNEKVTKHMLNYRDLWKNGILTESIVRTTDVTHYTKGKNFYGLYDVSGNVWEWTSTDIIATHGAEKGKLVKAVRGGSWKSDLESCKTTFRGEGRNPSLTFKTVGFRMVAEKEK